MSPTRFYLTEERNTSWINSQTAQCLAYKLTEWKNKLSSNSLLNKNDLLHIVAKFLLLFHLE